MLRFWDFEIFISSSIVSRLYIISLFISFLDFVFLMSNTCSRPHFIISISRVFSIEIECCNFFTFYKEIVVQFYGI